jgi:hypothetical protein
MTLRTNSPMYRREQLFYGTDLKVAYCEATNVETRQRTDTANGAVYLDARGPDREYQHNVVEFVKLISLKGVSGGEDIQPFYFKVKGGLDLRDLYLQDCGAAYVSGDINSADGSVVNGSEFCGIGIKDDPGDLDLTKEIRLARIIFADMPSGVPNLKVDQQCHTLRMDDILFLRSVNRKAGTLMTTPSNAGLARVTEKVGVYLIRGIHFENTEGYGGGLGLNLHNLTQAAGVTAGQMRISNITARNDGSTTYPAYTGDTDLIRVDNPLGGSPFFGASGGYFGHNQVQGVDRTPVGVNLMRNADNSTTYAGVRIAADEPYVLPAWAGAMGVTLGA